MIIWTKNTEYKKHQSEEERVQFIQKITTADTFLMIKIVNNILNIIVPILILWLSHDKLTFSVKLLVLAIGFIVMDFLLIMFEQLLFIEMPFRKTQKMSLQDVQNRINKLTEISQKLHQTKIPMLTQKAKHSEFYKGLLEMTQKKVTQIDRFIKADSAFVEVELEKLKEAEMKETKTSKNYEMWSEYFMRTKERLTYFANEKQFVMLEDIINSITALLEILNLKPYGECKINYALKVYLDELNIALGKIVSLSDEQDKNSYLNQLQEIATALTAEIQETIIRIDEVDKKDISSTLSTLLDELNRTDSASS